MNDGEKVKQAYLDGLTDGRKAREDEIKQLKQVCENRGAFIDWVGKHHEGILEDYTDFMEAGE